MGDRHIGGVDDETKPLLAKSAELRTQSDVLRDDSFEIMGEVTVQRGCKTVFLCHAERFRETPYRTFNSSA